MSTLPEQLVTVVPADVSLVLLVRAGLDAYRRAHRGENPRVDATLIAMTETVMRLRELTENGQNRAPLADTGASSPLLSTTQAAGLLRISERGVRREIAAGRIPATRAGRAWLIRRSDIDHYRETRQ